MLAGIAAPRESNKTPQRLFAAINRFPEFSDETRRRPCILRFGSLSPSFLRISGHVRSGSLKHYAPNPSAATRRSSERLAGGGARRDRPLTTKTAAWHNAGGPTAAVALRRQRARRSLWTPGATVCAADARPYKRGTSPLTHIREADPPTMIFHGLSDVALAPENSEHLLHALRAAKVPSELHTFAAVPHPFDSDPEFAESCAELTDFFLEREILHPRTYRPFAPAPGRGTGLPPSADFK